MRDWLTIVATSSRVKVEAASFFGSTPNRRSTAFAIQLSVDDDRVEDLRHPHQRRREHQHRAVGHREREVLGHHLAEHDVQVRHDQQRDDERDRRRRVPSASPVRPSGTASRWWIAGSETFRISSEQIVMPSWLVASMSVACSIAYSAVFAARDPFSASGSICERRAEMTANSAPTKNALNDQQHDQPGDSCPVAHRPLTPLGRVATSSRHRRCG